MAQSNSALLERDIGSRLAMKFTRAGYFVLREARRCHVEIDLVVCDPLSLVLAAYEIKRRNWKAVLAQAMRAQLYCHYAYAVMPTEANTSIDTAAFRAAGVGLVYYRCKGRRAIALEQAVAPIRSVVSNRSLRRVLYRSIAGAFAHAYHA